MKPLFSLPRFLRKVLSPAGRKILAIAICTLVALSITSLTSAQKSATPIGATKSSSAAKAPTPVPKARRNETKAAAQQSPLMSPVPVSGQGIRETVAEIMARETGVGKQNQGK